MNNWFKIYNLVKEYYNHYGNIDIPTTFKSTNGYDYDQNGISIGMWLLNQKNNRNLSTDQINKLSTLGIKFDDDLVVTPMEESESKKRLLVMLRREIRRNTFDNIEDVYTFLESMMKGEIKNTIIEYLYNYLYQVNNNKKMKINYGKGTVYLKEYRSDNDFTYSTIVEDDNVGDIKKVSVIFKKKLEGIFTKKCISYALNSAIDLMILNTTINNYSSKMPIDSIVEKEFAREDYSEIGLLREKEYPLYDTTNIKFPELSKCSYAINGELMPFDNTDKIKPVNMTYYSKKVLKYLKKLEKSKDLKSINNIMNDRDVNSFLNNYNNSSNEEKFSDDIKRR